MGRSCFVPIPVWRDRLRAVIRLANPVCVGLAALGLVAAGGQAVSGIGIAGRRAGSRPGSAVIPAPALASGVGNLANGHRPDRVVRGGVDAIHGNAAVEDGAVVIVEVVIVDDRRAIENLRRMIAVGAVITRMAFGEMIRSHEGEAADFQPEIKPDADARAAIEKSEARTIDAEWREGRPAAVFAAGTPRHPRRRPDGVRPPAPAEARMTEPAAVMKRRAPRVIGIPIPAAVGINPVAAVAVRLPAGIVNHRGRTPAASVAFDLDPRAIRRKIVVKIIHGHFRRWRGVGSARRRRGRGGNGGNASVVAHHRVDEVGGNAEVVEVNYLFGVEVEGARRIGDIGTDHVGVHAGLHQLDDLRERRAGSDGIRLCQTIVTDANRRRHNQRDENLFGKWSFHKVKRLRLSLIN